MNSTGKMLASVGDPVGKVTYWRSAAKPFQALGLISTGAADRFQLTAQDLALAAGSHNGEVVHTDQASGLMSQIGCQLSDLVYGAHPPGGFHWTRRQPRNYSAGTRARRHCTTTARASTSGCWRLPSTCAPIGGDTRTRSTRVQSAIVQTVADFSDTEEIVLGVDGCGIPCLGTSVYAVALAFARLMDPQGAAQPHSAAAGAIRSAMSVHPYLVAGRGRLDTDLMLALPDGLISKGGAAGVQCVGLPGGIGLAVKMEDGSSGPPPNPGAVATLAVLHERGCTTTSRSPRSLAMPGRHCAASPGQPGSEPRRDRVELA